MGRDRRGAALLINRNSTGPGDWIDLNGGRFSLAGQVGGSTAAGATVVLEGTPDTLSTAPEVLTLATWSSTTGVVLSTGVQPVNRVRGRVTVLTTSTDLSHVVSAWVARA